MFDCGVYVCKYAYAMYQLREQAFTYADADRSRAPFYDFITNGDGFKFDMNDIKRLRKEIHILARRLSDIYRRRNPTTDDAVSLVTGDISSLWGRHSATAKMKMRERLTAIPTPVPEYVMACYKDHYDNNCAASDDSEDAIRILPGDVMKVKNVLFNVLDFLHGQIFYGTALTDHVSLARINLVVVEIQCPTGWLTITEQNWGRIVVKRSPATSRALIKDYMQRTNEKSTELLVYGTEDDPCFRSIEALHRYPRRDESILSGKVVSTLKTSASCFMCGGLLDPTENWSEKDPNGYVMHCKAASRRTSLLAHMRECHPATPFVFLDDWKNAQEKEFVDVKAFCQEALFDAYVNVGLNLDVFEDIQKTRTDEVLKLQLAGLFGWAACYVQYRLRGTWKRRAFFEQWLGEIKKKGSTFFEQWLVENKKRTSKEGIGSTSTEGRKGTATKEAIIAIAKTCEEKIVMAIMAWIKFMDEGCRKFDFVAFLDFHNGNWRYMWNSMVYFFIRGLYFTEDYPPVSLSARIVHDNFNIVEKLEEIVIGGQEVPESLRF